MINEGTDAAFEKKIAELWEGKDDRIEKAKCTLIDHYTKQQNSQATRLIGFVAALFVLLQITQTGIGKELTKIFSNFPTITLFDNFPLVWDSLKFIFLFLATSVILYYILRTIFRFPVFAFASAEVKYITKSEARAIVREFAKHDKKEPKYYEFRELWAVNRATFRNVYKKTMYKKIHANWFSPPALPDEYSHEKNGIILCALLASAVALMLLLFLW